MKMLHYGNHPPWNSSVRAWITDWRMEHFPIFCEFYFSMATSNLCCSHYATYSWSYLVLRLQKTTFALNLKIIKWMRFNANDTFSSEFSKTFYKMYYFKACLLTPWVLPRAVFLRLIFFFFWISKKKSLLIFTSCLLYPDFLRRWEMISEICKTQIQKVYNNIRFNVT